MCLFVYVFACVFVCVACLVVGVVACLCVCVVARFLWLLDYLVVCVLLVGLCLSVVGWLFVCLVACLCVWASARKFLHLFCSQPYTRCQKTGSRFGINFGVGIELCQMPRTV